MVGIQNKEMLPHAEADKSSLTHGEKDGSVSLGTLQHF